MRPDGSEVSTGAAVEEVEWVERGAELEADDRLVGAVGAEVVVAETDVEAGAEAAEEAEEVVVAA